MSDLLHIYGRLQDHFGPSGWWPADSPFEVAVGAILVQNCSWHNALLAIRNLREAQLLSPQLLHAMEQEPLGELIRPSGYYRSKAKKLKAFVSHLMINYEGDMQALAARPLVELRPELLTIYGIGPETADSILCYALDQPVMVVDAYTARIFHRLGLLPEKVRYDEMQHTFAVGLPADLALLQDYHGQIVRLGQHYCRKRRPLCQECPLTFDCPRQGVD